MTREALGKVLMVQGTGSSVGKSVLVAGLCRLFARTGLRVAPFKAQNMSLNSYVTLDGGEIARSTAEQAAAAGIEPTVDMNPVLLKPEGNARSQVIVRGRPVGSLAAREYYRDRGKRQELWSLVTESLNWLRGKYDLVVIEGAGSPVELNLKQGDIVNMAVARWAQAPVLLVGNIDHGGIFASLIGTCILLEPEERVLVAGLVVNKFRGDSSLFAEGVRILEDRSGVPVLGVLPFLPDLRVAEEDSTALDPPRLQSGTENAEITIAVPRLPRISNFDDFDPLQSEPGVRVRFVDRPEHLGTPDLLVLPGSKSTLSDLEWLRQSGLADLMMRLAEGGTPVIGICGGFQIMGTTIYDPEHVESPESQAEGLGLLPVTTTFGGTKATHRVTGRVSPSAARGLLAGAEGAPLSGYEIHMGISNVEGESAFTLSRSGEVGDHPDGALSEDGLRLGTYVHGLFQNDAVRQSVLCAVHSRSGREGAELLRPGVSWSRQASYDRLADMLGEHMDMERLWRIVGLDRVTS